MQQGAIAEPTQDVQIIADTIAEYLKANKTFNRWFEHGPIQLYVRRQKVILSRDKGISDALVIARATIDEDHQGKGLMTGFLNLAESLVKTYAPQAVLYLENVENVDLRKHLESRGYTKKSIDSNLVAYYWEPR